MQPPRSVQASSMPTLLLTKSVSGGSRRCASSLFSDLGFYYYHLSEMKILLGPTQVTSCGFRGLPIKT